MFDHILNLIFVVILIKPTIDCFRKKSKMFDKLNGVYTEESINTYGNITGIDTIIAILFIILIDTEKSGITHFGLFPLWASTKSIVICVAFLAVVIVLYLVARYVVLKPISGKKAKKAKDDDELDF